MRRIIAMLMVLMLLPALALAEAVGDEPVVSEALFDAVEEQGEIELAAPEEIAGPAAEVMAPEAPEAIEAVEAVDALLPKAAEVTKLTLGVGETYTLSIQNIKSCRSDHKSVAEVSLLSPDRARGSVCSRNSTFACPRSLFTAAASARSSERWIR